METTLGEKERITNLEVFTRPSKGWNTNTCDRWFSEIRPFDRIFKLFALCLFYNAWPSKMVN